MAPDLVVRLDGWKAVADYLGRDVRTAQRWRDERGMPMHRVPGHKGGTVFAERAELDAWLFQHVTPAPSLSAGGDRGDAAPPPAHSRAQLVAVRNGDVAVASRPPSTVVIAVSVVAIGTIIFGGVRMIRATLRARSASR